MRDDEGGVVDLQPAIRGTARLVEYSEIIRRKYPSPNSVQPISTKFFRLRLLYKEQLRKFLSDPNPGSSSPPHLLSDPPARPVVFGTRLLPKYLFRPPMYLSSSHFLLLRAPRTPKSYHSLGFPAMSVFCYSSKPLLGSSSHPSPTPPRHWRLSKRHSA